MSTTTTNRAARGCAVLDEKVPGWADKIDLSRLDIYNCTDCLLGQLFGNYDDGLSQLSREPEPWDWSGGHGFNVRYSTREELNLAWRDAILARRQSELEATR